MNYSIYNLIPKIPSSQYDEYTIKKFIQNNFRILLLSFFLMIEQTCYGIFVSTQGTLLQKIYFGTAILMIIFFMSSLYFYYYRPDQITILHNIYETSIGLLGLMIAVFRIVFTKQQLPGLPTVYIAVIYGMAFIFYYNFKQSFLIYFSCSLILILSLSIYKPSLQFDRYLADIISNNIIALIASVINYHKFMKEFINKKTIEQKNNKLLQKNKEIKKINDKLYKISITDELTGMYNRRKIEEIMKKVYAKAERYNREFSIILLDIDNFKDINDNFGHPVGDKILIKITKLLTENIRTVDTCGRWGGEEFLIVCPETELNSAYDLATRLKSLIEYREFPRVEKVTASFGVASYSENKEIKDIIKTADKSLYQAKQNGRNKVEAINHTTFNKQNKKN